VHGASFVHRKQRKTLLEWIETDFTVSIPAIRAKAKGANINESKALNASIPAEKNNRRIVGCW